MRANNAPQSALSDTPKEYIIATVNSLGDLHRLGRVSTDAETEERINEYFAICAKTGLRPGIESLCLSLGITRQTLGRWTRGENCSPYRQQLVISARQYIAACLEQMLVSGRGSTVGCIFALKNWLSYQDTTTVEHYDRPSTYAASMTPEEIARQIEKDIPIDGEYEESTS